MENEMVAMLRTSAEADRQKALLTLKLLTQHPAGIGDHSTKDFYDNAEQALAMLVDADDRIAALERHFPLAEKHPGALADRRSSSREFGQENRASNGSLSRS